MDGSGNKAEEDRVSCLPPRWTPHLLHSRAAHSTHRPEQILVVHHHLHHLGCPLCQLLLLAPGEFGGLPSVQEEIRGHHCRNVPQSHLVAPLPGHHLPEEFQECLQGAQDLLPISAPPWCPCPPQNTLLCSLGACGRRGGRWNRGFSSSFAISPPHDLFPALRNVAQTLPLPCSLRD